MLPQSFPVLVEFFIVIVLTNISSRIFCDMSEIIFIMLSLMKTDSSYAFGRRCLYVLYKIEAIIQYCEINFHNLLVKMSMSVIILLLWCTIEKRHPKSSLYQRKITGIMLSYSSIYLFTAQSHNHQKFYPQRRCLFFPIYHIPHDTSTTNELCLLSKSMNDQYPNSKGLNLVPFLLWPKIHSYVSRKSLTACCDSSSSAGCIKIYLIPYTLKSVLRKVGLSVSNISKTGEDVTPFFNSLKNSINVGVQAINGIGFLYIF